MERVEVTTIVYADVETVFDFLLDFPGYAAYSKHLKDVRQRGDGGPGTAYELEFAWWKLGYNAHSTVTAIDRPERIDWRITKDIDATGYWQATPVDPEDGSASGESATVSGGTNSVDSADSAQTEDSDQSEDPGQTEHSDQTEDPGQTEDSDQTEDSENSSAESTPATEVRLVIEYDASTAQLGRIDLPRFVSVSWVVEKVKPKIKTEATRIVERVVADLEGSRREIDLEVRTDRSPTN